MSRRVAIVLCSASAGIIQIAGGWLRASSRFVRDVDREDFAADIPV